jgi:hypothetical protein
MHQVASDLNKAKREPFFDVVLANRDHRLSNRWQLTERYFRVATTT